MQKTTIAITAAILFILAVIFFAAFFGDERIALRLQRDEGGLPEHEVNVLLLGRVAEGQGGRWHLAPGLVDTVVVFHYRPETNTVNLISLPRDLYGAFGRHPYKLNEIYRRKEIENFLEKLPEITGVSTDKYLVVDIGILEDTVDALGGIDVTLSATVTDPVGGFRLGAGEHHLSGEDTAWLIRNRNAPGGDFFREANQHLVIASIFDRFEELTRTERTKFYFAMIPETGRIESNFNTGELIGQFGNLDELNFNSIVIGFETGLLRSAHIAGGQIVTSTPAIPAPTATSATSTAATSTATTTSPVAAYVLLPTAGMDNYTAIREFIQGKIQ